MLLSTLHQSSLGSLYLIVPQKLHPLWYSPTLPLLFYVSAIGAGLGMIIVESHLSGRAFGRRLELDLLEPLGRAMVVVLAVFGVLRLQALARSGALPLALQPDLRGTDVPGRVRARASCCRSRCWPGRASATRPPGS